VFPHHTYSWIHKPTPEFQLRELEARSRLRPNCGRITGYAEIIPAPGSRIRGDQQMPYFKLLSR
jgi:hypothetical protein